MPFVILNGLRFHYELHGELGEALVIVHGYMGSIEDWRAQIDEFASRYRILILDNRGHGETEAPAKENAYSVEQMVDDTEQLISHVGFERYHLVGHSVGGAVAQEIALRNPKRVLTLTLVDTTDSFAGHPVGTPPFVPPKRMKVAAERRAKMPKEALSGGWAALDAWRGSTDRVGAIRAPTTIIYGDRDASASIEGSRKLKELIPHATLVAIEGSGHSPHFEIPGRFNEELRRSLQTKGAA